MRCLHSRLTVLAGSLLASPTFAADSVAPAPYSGMLQMVGSLALVVAVLGAVTWILRRYSRPVAMPAGFLRVVTAQSLGPRERIVVVEAGESWLVLGVTAQSVATLHIMPRQEIPAELEAGSRFHFSRILSRALQLHAKN